MFNEYLTAEENETINQDLELTSTQIMDREEQEITTMEQELEEMEKELATFEILPLDAIDNQEFTITDLENYANEQSYKQECQEQANIQIEELNLIEA